MSQMERLARGYVSTVKKRPFTWLLFYLALAGLGVFAGLTLTINMDLKTLLPQNTPSVRALEASQARRGSNDLFTIAVESPDPYANVAMIRALAERLEEWPEVRWVQTDQDPTFFREHVLLYLPIERLETLRSRLRVSLRCELQTVNPAFVELSDSCTTRETSWNLEDWIGGNLTTDLGLPDDFFGDTSELLGSATEGSGEGATSSEGTGEQAGLDEGTGQTTSDAADEPPPLPDELSHYIISADGRIVVLYAQLTRSSTDVQFANDIQHRGTDLIAELDPLSFNPEMRAEVVGTFKSLNEAEAARDDSNKTFGISLALVVGIMFVYFRNVRGLLIVVFPLLIGVAWTMGVTRLTYGQLNLYTMFVASVLLGMGIDYGVHLYGRAMEGFRAGMAWDEALVEALHHTGSAIVASAATAVAAFLTLTFSHFQGFAEFGVISAYGICLCMFSTWLVLPPLLLALEKIFPLRGRPRITETDPAATAASLASQRRQRRVWLLIFALVSGALVYGVLSARKAEFEYDFRNLRGPSSAAGIRYGQAVGRGRTTTPSIALGNSQEQMREVHHLLLQRLRDGDPVLKGFITIETYVPADQTARLEIIADISENVNRRALNRLAGEPRAMVDLLRDLVDVQPFTVADVPGWALRTLTESDGVTVGNIGLIFAKLEEWDVRQVQAYQDRYGSLEVASGTVHVASGTFITADVISTVQDDGQRMGLLVLIVVAVVLLISLRSVKGMLVCMAGMGAAFVLTLGAMVLTGTKVGMYNMIVLPTVVGISIDGAIHLYHRFKEEKTTGISHLMRTTGIAIVAASLTNSAGFIGLMFQQHMGIRSIGSLAILGMLSALVAVFLFMPGLLILTEGRKQRAARLKASQALATQTPAPDAE